MLKLSYNVLLTPWRQKGYEGITKMSAQIHDNPRDTWSANLGRSICSIRLLSGAGFNPFRFFLVKSIVLPGCEGV
jgi:hypothetical protein